MSTAKKAPTAPGAASHARRRPRPNNRQKEEAEITRLTKLTREIPRYSLRFMLFRKNRRQKAKQLEQSETQTGPELPIFSATRFSQLPLSTRTLDGLAGAGFVDLTPIQRVSIPQALAERDVLAAAPTGSGKTLAFLVPMLETLWRDKWTTQDGLAAVVISPTRELSTQIFDVLRKVAKFHPISAGAVVGGKDFNFEREKVGNMNILVCTPGRLLHHMDHVAELDCSSLKMLVLDEADRILDMGFSKTLDAILENLPRERQTLLFSATQTKDVKALARLSLKSPEYVAVTSKPQTAINNQENTSTKEEDATTQADDNSAIKLVGTPEGLTQSCAIVKAHEKLSVLWSFIKTHLKSKMIIFLSSGKQVRFVFETFRKMKPGMSLLHLHGNMKTQRRAEMCEAFRHTKCAALFSTDLAARGLDFPDVEWVIQADCPDEVGTYIHRVGRTARFKSSGRAMLLVHEGKQEVFLERLKKAKIELQRTRINSNRMTSIDGIVLSIVTSSQEMRSLAQKAFTIYLKSIYQQADKEVFDVMEFDFALLAKSYGLSVAPSVSFKGGAGTSNKVKEAKLKAQTVFGYDARHVKEDSDEDDEKPLQTGSRKRSAPIEEKDDSDSEDDILTVKQTLHVPEADEIGTENVDGVDGKVQRKRKKRKLDLFKNLPAANRIVFDEDGNSIRGDVAIADGEDVEAEERHDGIEDYAKSVSRRLAENADEDKKREKSRVKALHSKRKQKEKELNRTLRPQATAIAEITARSNDDEDMSERDEDSSDNESSEGVEDDVQGLDDQEALALKILQSRR